MSHQTFQINSGIVRFVPLNTKLSCVEKQSDVEEPELLDRDSPDATESNLVGTQQMDPTCEIPENPRAHHTQQRSPLTILCPQYQEFNPQLQPHIVTNFLHFQFLPTSKHCRTSSRR